MAVELGIGQQYDFVYGLASEVEHASIAALPFYVVQQGLRLRMASTTTGNWGAALHLSYWLLWATFEAADTYLELGWGEHLDNARANLPNLGRG